MLVQKRVAQHRQAERGVSRTPVPLFLYNPLLHEDTSFLHVASSLSHKPLQLFALYCHVPARQPLGQRCQYRNAVRKRKKDLDKCKTDH